MTERSTGDPRITTELQELGRQLTLAIKAGSQDLRELGDELRAGFTEMSSEIGQALSHIRARDEVQQARTQAARLADTVRSSQAQQEIREEVVEALHALNVHLKTLLTGGQPGQEQPAAEPTAERPTAEPAEPALAQPLP